MNEKTAFAEMSELSTAIISDAMFRMGHKDRTMRARIKPVDEMMRTAGPACTAQAYPGATYASSLAVEAAEPGDVIVIDAQSFLEAVMWGEIYSLMAMERGIAGTIVDGAVRDIDDVRDMGYPLFAAGVHPGAGTGDKLGKVNVPIQCGGVIVRRGDLIFGDLLGVVVVPPEELLEVHQWCRKVMEKEEQMKADIRARMQAGREE